MSKSSTPMTKPNAKQFRCVHCGYDLLPLRTNNADTQCPECGKHTDPYNPRAHLVRAHSLDTQLRIIFSLALLTVLPFAIVTFALLGYFVFAILSVPAIAPACFYSERIIHRTPTNTRRITVFLIGIGWLLGAGIGAGVVIYFA